MKKMLFVIGVLAILLLAACGATQNEPDAVSVVQNFYAAIADGELETAMGYVADDALFINPTGTYTGKDEVRDNISALIDGGFVFELRDLVNEEGKVTYGYTLFIGGENVEEGDNGVTIVRNGKVVFDGLEEGIPASLQ
jgi:ketosteroid isomerase-like protein